MVKDRCVEVYDIYGKKLEPCTLKTALVLLARKRAEKISDKAIRLIATKKDFKKMKRKIIDRDNRTCFYCGKKIPENENATIDHIVPKQIKNGVCGYDTEENLVCACLFCNKYKNNSDATDYISFRMATLLGYILFKCKIKID